MKALLFFLSVATVICVQCNGQFSNKCLPRPMRVVPVTLQIKNVSAHFKTSVCKDGQLAISELADLAQQQIMDNYRQTFDCELASLRHRLCTTAGLYTHHVTIYYLANLTCGNKCYYLGQHDRNNRDARKFFSTQVNILRQSYRAYYNSSFSYNDMLVEVFYFSGRKVGFHFNCDDGNQIQGGVSKKVPACRCPSNCTNPCELPPNIGTHQGRFLRYYHNATSRQCQKFVYRGGREGNQNRFLSQDECETACNVCPEGMVYKCGTSCPSTCDRMRRFPCTLQCVQGCFCKEGTVLLEKDGEVCVAPEECPVTGSGQECPEGMVYKECGCPTTCADNKDEVPSCTTLQCESGCFCKEGTVLLEAGGEKCVEEFECPIIAN